MPLGPTAMATWMPPIHWGSTAARLRGYQSKNALLLTLDERFLRAVGRGVSTLEALGGGGGRGFDFRGRLVGVVHQRGEG